MNVTNKVPIEIMVNGEKINTAVSSIQPLVHFLRDNLKLTGTHIGCDCVSCGACTVLLDDEPVKSCAILAAQCNQKQITTVEGLETDQGYSILQKSFQQQYALQCGYCTPGFLMIGTFITKNFTELKDEEIAELLRGNYCRCTGYTPIIKAIKESLGKE